MNQGRKKRNTGLREVRNFGLRSLTERFEFTYAVQSPLVADSMTKIAEDMSLRVAEEITELVGLTPVLHLKRIVPADAADVYAKLE
jgi:hypothetical protein